MNKIRLTILFMFVCVVCMFIGSCSVNAETLTNQRIYSVWLSGYTNATIDGNYSYSNGVMVSNVLNGGASTASTNVRILFSNLSDSQLSNKIITFTMMPVGNNMGSVRIRDNNSHIYACENYQISRDGWISVICPYVGELKANGISVEYTTWGSFNQRHNISVFNTFDSDTNTLMNIYSSLLNLATTNHTDNTNIINAINNLKSQENTNTQSIINNQNQNAQQQHNDAQQQYNFISDNTIDNSTTTDANNISNNISSDGKNAVLDFMLLPVNFFQNIINSFSNSCSTITIPSTSNGNSGGFHDNWLYFTFPCINLQSILGSNVYNLIDALMCFVMLFAFVRSVVNFAKKALLLESDVSSEVGVF